MQTDKRHSNVFFFFSSFFFFFFLAVSSFARTIFPSDYIIYSSVHADCFHPSPENRTDTTNINIHTEHSIACIAAQQHDEKVFGFRLHWSGSGFVFLRVRARTEISHSALLLSTRSANQYCYRTCIRCAFINSYLISSVFWRWLAQARYSFF